MDELNLKINCNEVKTICFRENVKSVDNIPINLIMAMQAELYTMLPLDEMTEDAIFVLLCIKDKKSAMCFAKEKGICNWMDASLYLMLCPEDKMGYLEATKRGEDILYQAIIQYSMSSNIAIYHYCNSEKYVEIHFIKDKNSVEINRNFTDKYIGTIMERDKAVAAFDGLLGREVSESTCDSDLVNSISSDDIVQLDFEHVLDIYSENMRKLIPGVCANISGATDEEISSVELKIGILFPNNAKKLYRFMDGDSENIMGFILGMEMFSLDRMLKVWNSWREFDNDKELNNPEFFSSEPSKMIKLRYCNPGWIPLSGDNSSNYIGIDLDPDVNGNVGQVISFGKDENDKIVIASSLLEFFRWAIMLQPEMRMFTNGKQYLYLNRENEHPIDWIKKKLVVPSP